MTDILSIAVLDWLLEHSRELPRDVNYRLYDAEGRPIHLINTDLILYILFNEVVFTNASEISRDENGQPIVYESSDDEMLHNMRLMLGDF